MDPGLLPGVSMNLKKNTQYLGFLARKEVSIAPGISPPAFTVSYQSEKNPVSGELRTRRRFSLARSARNGFVLIPPNFYSENVKKRFEGSRTGLVYEGFCFQIAVNKD